MNTLPPVSPACGCNPTNMTTPAGNRRTVPSAELETGDRGRRPESASPAGRTGYGLRSNLSPSTKRCWRGKRPVWLQLHRIRSYVLVITTSSSVFCMGWSPFHCMKTTDYRCHAVLAQAVTLAERPFQISTRRWRVKGKAVKGIRGKFSTDGNRQS